MSPVGAGVRIAGAQYRLVGNLPVRRPVLAHERSPSADDPAMVDAGSASGPAPRAAGAQRGQGRSEEHTSELQSLMRISYAVFCLKKKNTYTRTTQRNKITSN